MEMTKFNKALELVQEIDFHLATGTGHYYDRQGRRLAALGEVITAILTDNLLTQEDLCSANTTTTATAPSNGRGKC